MKKWFRMYVVKQLSASSYLPKPPREQDESHGWFTVGNLTRERVWQELPKKVLFSPRKYCHGDIRAFDLVKGANPGLSGSD